LAPLQGSTAIGILVLEAVQQLGLLVTAEPGPTTGAPVFFDNAQAIQRVTTANSSRFTADFQLFERELPHGLEHDVPGLSCAVLLQTHQASVHQRCNARERVEV